MSYFCYAHNWASPIYSCPQCNKLETYTTGSTFALNHTSLKHPCAETCSGYKQSSEEANARISAIESQLSDAREVIAVLSEALEFYADIDGGHLDVTAIRALESTREKRFRVME